MTKKYVLKIATILIVFLSLSATSQNSNKLWTSVNVIKAKQSEQVLRKIKLKTEKYFQLNLEGLKSALLNVGNRENRGNIIISFPNSEGKLNKFKVFEASIMEPELQAQFPNMRSYAGHRVDNSAEIIRFSITPKGFHAMFLGTSSSTQFIDPFSEGGHIYTVYSKTDLEAINFDFECGVIDDPILETAGDESLAMARNANDGILRDYRIAIACTAEYTAFHGGTVDAAMAAMVVTMTRVNGVYERDLSITMTMVPNSSIIFTNSETDPFDNNNTSLLINQSQEQINALIGPTNYDIGHTLSTGAGGLAGLGVTCSDGSKARGVTGIAQPVGDAFDIDYVAHELGHQFGAPHTFNGNQGNCQGGNRSPFDAYETGSGTTVMAYAGICGSDNVQDNSDAYFHQSSLLRIWTHINSTGVCPINQSITGNSAPVVDAGADYTIPSRTPYRLTGSSTDVDGIGSHTYTWEQYDLGPSGLPSPSLTEGPLVRSFLPNVSSTRYIPQLEDYLDVFGQSTTWEVMASVTRDINFRLTVRDNDVRGGQVAVEGMVVSVTSTAGPLRIISQNGLNISYEGLSTQTISWQVNGTNTGVVGAENVNILLSTDGGLTYDTTVLANTPNDGSQEVQIPNVDASNCRFMIEAVGNIFYNINFRDFAITQNLSIEDLELNNLSIYPNPNNGEFNIGFDSRSGEAITLELYDIRGRVIYTKSYTSVSHFEKVISLNNVQSGVYLLTLSDGPLKVTKKIIVD